MLFKKIIFSSILIFSFIYTALAQTNRYNKPITYQSNYKPETYKPNTELLIKALEAKQSRYNTNREYLEGVIDWIYSLKSSIRDEDILQFLDKKSKELRLFEDKDLSVLREVIRHVEFQVKDRIEEYTREMEEQNIRRIQELEAEKVRLEQASSSGSSQQENFYRTSSPVEPKLRNNSSTIQERTYDSTPRQERRYIPQTLETFYVTQSTSFRESPDSKGSIIKRFKINDAVEVLDCSDTWWCKVRHQGNIGWVKKKLIEN